MTVSGGTGALGIIHVSGLPTGLAAVLTGGTISFTGVPSVAKTFANAAITIQDAVGASITRTFSITIHPTPAIGHLTRDRWTAGKSGFNATLTVTGGTGPFSITNATGLPTGLTAVLKGKTIRLAGVPTQVGSFSSGSVTIQDAAGASAGANFTITINPLPAVGDLSLSQWTATRPGFVGTMAISGGTGPFTITAASGVPAGLSFKVIGNAVTLTGTPTVPVTAANGSVTIRDASGASITKTFSIVINPAPTMSALTMTQWTVYQPAFTGSMTIGGGTGSFTISHASGLPAGLSAVLSGKTISFTGVPTVAGTFHGSITVQDAVGAKVTRTFTITIHVPLSLGQFTRTQGTVGKAGFPGTMAISGGTGPFRIIASNGLPPGLSAVVRGRTIRLTGKPSVAGVFLAASLTIEDAAGAIATTSFSITIDPQ
jgi:hypothetical protein